jgi:DNA-binding MarR family transcriptional regulator
MKLETHANGARARKSRTSFRPTQRDLEMVRFAGRHRAMEGRQVAERFGMHLSNAHRRLGGLVQLGLLEHKRLLHARAGVYLATELGLHFVGLEPPAARIDLRT